MSRTKKAVIIGSVLVGIGVIIGVIAIAIGGFKFPSGAVDLTSMKALNTEKKTVQVTDAFDKIEVVGADSMDIEICKSKTGENYVEYYDTDDWTSHVDVKDHVLKFTTDDKGKHKSVVSLGFGKDTRTRIYLTDAEYKEISVITMSGDIEMLDVTTEGLNVSTSSGDMDLVDVTAKQMKLDASSGDIDLERCDAEGFDITTSSGDVDMEIAAGRTYRFETKTNSGDVDVPDGDADAKYLCRIVTSSGDVDVEQK